ncbi:hypothetical protein [Paenibacillus sp. YYML68]|uniref:hypothetical protein n=1 Tax=Paenibacillus sp. YYML68 TaxID=2909250 RepID=UPI0024900A75|nr:hypothetical protein [Paenibacillus sp. YYML68]
MIAADQLIRKVSKYVTFGQPVASGSVISQRLADPRIPILAYYLTLIAQEGEKDYYHEVWLKKDGSFALTEAWYRESTVSRKLLKDDLSYEQLLETIGETEVNAIMMRISETIKKSERDDWRRYSSRA